MIPPHSLRKIKALIDELTLTYEEMEHSGPDDESLYFSELLSELEETSRSLLELAINLQEELE
jgi:hypothetical protein